MPFDAIPQELKDFKQWICWKYDVTPDGKKTKLPLRPIDGRLASVTDPRDWQDFGTAVAASVHCDGIGFVFTKSDPFCGVDLDNAFSDENSDKMRALCESLDSYSEFSPSGNGIHTIVKAVLDGTGARRGGIEIYDNSRFFTFTGNVLFNKKIMDRQEIIAALRKQIKPDDLIVTQDLGQANEAITDEQLQEAAASAANGEKFKRLFSGDWQTDYGHASQSEADFALINILAFYSRNVAQITRVFRSSGLGKRDKAKRGAYVGNMVKRAFDKMPALVSHAQVQGVWFDATRFEPWANAKLSLSAAPPYAPPKAVEPAVTLPPDNLPPIPGLVGRLAAHCYHASTYPVPEVAIASALATMAVLCSRSYRLGNNSLALYILLLAKTSIGKSFAYQAQHAWVNALYRRFSDPTGGLQYKARREFLENLVIGHIGSGSGLAQHMVKSPSTLAQLDEFVVELKRMGHPNANPNDMAILKELLTLVDAAKPGAIYRGKTYSDRGAVNKTLPSVPRACFNLLGTGTPEQFYNDLNNGILEGGLLPRFILIEYEGTLPEKNHNEVHQIDVSVLNELTQLFNRSFELNQEITGNIDQYINITAVPEAKALQDGWERYCEGQVRIAHQTNAPVAGLWSRASAHVNQVAALIAVGVNPHVPVIEPAHVTAALSIVKPGLVRLVGKVIGGEVGEGDTRAEAEIRKFVQRIRSEGYGFMRHLGGSVSSEVAQTDYIQVSVMRNYVRQRAPFARHKLGANRAFDDTINAMIKNGDFVRRDFLVTNNRKISTVLPQFS